MKRSLHQRWSNIAVNVALAALVVVPVYAATTIGNNISTGGSIILTNGGGNLGVGTSTPANLFSVHGNALISGNVTSVANITATGTLTLSGTTGTSTIANGQGFTIGSSQFVLQQGSGSVGIGTTSPMAALSLNAGQFVTAAGTAAAPSWTFTTDSISGVFLPATSVLGFSTGGSERVRIDSNGRLGIGTTTPGTPLGVTGAGVFTGPLTFTWLNATSTTATSTLSTGGLAVGTNQFVVQQTSGSVGIGTTTPSQLFSVHGNSYHSGTSFFGGVITGTSTLNITGLTTLGNASTSALSTTGNFYVNGYATTTGANGNIATAGTLGVTGASTLTGGVTVGTGNAITGIIGGYCTFTDVTSFTASTTKYTDCTTTPTGALTTATRVLVQATSSLQSMYVIQAASSTGVSTINLRILNTGLDGAADTTLEGTSINFWAFR